MTNVIEISAFRQWIDRLAEEKIVLPQQFQQTLTLYLNHFYLSRHYLSPVT